MLLDTFPAMSRYEEMVSTLAFKNTHSMNSSAALPSLLVWGNFTLGI